jgi:hypothetical protein
MSFKLKYAGLMMRYGINFWGPFIGSGIKVTGTNRDFTRIEVELKERFYNRNIVGVHFGGSLYAMCDPFFMGILLHHLGREFIIWDKGASIRFKRPGKGTVRAVFEIPMPEIERIRREASTANKLEPVFKAEIHDNDGKVVAEVEKLLYVKRKTKAAQKSTSSHAPISIRATGPE